MHLLHYLAFIVKKTLSATPDMRRAGRASWYRHITSRLAAAGIACVQYDLPLKSVNIQPKIEVNIGHVQATCLKPYSAWTSST
jgi:hypothetical protein